ncbi:4'-phosphopantetheinyl transferase superfamily protein [Paenibacillus sp. M1]|uniref:4'-phosphopantetheinyl transferase superfamily protein n=1 Tax=Paenibacillus haidiansis TaxID=1574488 RepID=A0ABU7VRL1_9BACL
MLKVYGVQLTQEPAPALLEALLSALPAHKQARIKRFLRPADALRSLTADILSRYILCQYLGIHNGEISFTENSYGKPALHGTEGLHFNHSHSGRWVVSVIADTHCGIDVEEIREADLAIAEHFFAVQEIADLLAAPEERRRDCFFDLWTLKESYVKAAGRGLSLPLSSFAIRKEVSGGITLQTQNEFRDCHFKQYQIDPDYKMSVCAQSRDFPGQLEVIPQDELYGHFLHLV